jgi:hypothetical protein
LFLASVFQRLKYLKVDNVPLFYEKGGSLWPERDCALESIEDFAGKRAMIRAYYRAIGRMFLYSIVMRIPVPTMVLPNLYRNYLLRGIEPELANRSDDDCQDDEYREGDLLEDTFGDVSDASKDRLREILSFEDPAKNRTHFRSGVQQRFIKDCELALSGLGDGLVHTHAEAAQDGVPDKTLLTELFHAMPGRVIDSLLFGKFDVDPDDLINILGRSDERDEDAVADKILCITNDGIHTGYLPALIKRKGREGDGAAFLRKFLYFCSGQEYIPLEGDSFSIIISFSLPRDARPLSRSFGSLELPIEAYGGQPELLEAKLNESLEILTNAANSMPHMIGIKEFSSDAVSG